MSQTQTAPTELGSESIGKLLKKYAVPGIIAMTASSLYNMVDSIYIGHIPGSGSLAISGLAVTFPLMNLSTALGTLVGVGAATMLSILLGQRNYKAANKVLANEVTLNCIIGLLFTVFCLAFLDPILYFFGASANTLEYARNYMEIILYGNVITHLYFGLNNIIRSSGNPKMAMGLTLFTVILNSILDPIFIFGLHMGVSGAAVATVISQMASCAFVLNTLFGKNMPVRITFGGYSWRLIRRVLTIGFTPFIIIAMDNVMIITMNAILQKYGGAERGDLLITCATIAQSFMLVVTMPLGGITSGTQAVLAYNFGAGKTDRVQNAQKYIFSLAAAYTALLFVLARTIGGLFVRLFTADPIVAAEALRAIRIFTLAIITLAFQYEIVDGFTGLGQVQVALPLSFFRKGAYFVSLFLLPAVFGAEAAFYAEPVSDILGPIASVIVYLTSMKKVLAKAGAN